MVILELRVRRPLRWLLLILSIMFLPSFPPSGDGDMSFSVLVVWGVHRSVEITDK